MYRIKTSAGIKSRLPFETANE